MNPTDTEGLLDARIRLDIPNPCRDIFFMCNPYMAPAYNAPFLATRTMTGTVNTLPNASQYPWWPDAVGLSANQPSLALRPAFALSDAEPISGYEVDYQGSLVRFRTEGGALFRSVVPSLEQRKSPWVNRYYYNFPLGVQMTYRAFVATHSCLLREDKTTVCGFSGVNVISFDEPRISSFYLHSVCR
jgi:hypothetical protein